MNISILVQLIVYSETEALIFLSLWKKIGGIDPNYRRDAQDKRDVEKVPTL